MIRTKLTLSLAAAAIGALGLSGCAKHTEVAQNEAGVCYTLSQKADGTLVYHSVKTGLTQMEQCAAALELMRRNYLALGGSNEETLGAYGGRFIFLMKDGIYMGQTLEGDRYLALLRTNDGRLVMPGAVVQQQ